MLVTFLVTLSPNLTILNIIGDEWWRVTRMVTNMSPERSPERSKTALRAAVPLDLGGVVFAKLGNSSRMVTPPKVIPRPCLEIPWKEYSKSGPTISEITKMYPIWPILNWPPTASKQGVFTIVNIFHVANYICLYPRRPFTGFSRHTETSSLDPADFSEQKQPVTNLRC